MSLLSDELVGAQEPRVAHAPDGAWSHADDAAFLASSYGLTPDPWQHLVLTAWLAEDAAGKWAAGRCGLAVPRQNGKNGCIEIRELYGIVALGEKFLHTAHEVKTARKAFLRLASFFEDPRQFPELHALVKEIRRTNGQEAIVLTNGGSVEFVARSRGSGRGFTVDVLVLDEAQELSDEQLEALMPTISAAPTGNPQIILTGTPPGEGCAGEVWTRTRAAGVEGTDRRLSWHEWSVDGDVDPSDRALWAATNPALGIRLSLSVLEDELATMSREGFIRERLGKWRPAADIGARLITPDQWEATGVADPPTEGVKSFGVAFSLDGLRVSVAGAMKHQAGVHVELVGAHSGSVESGIGPLADWLAQRWRDTATVVISGSAGSTVLADALVDRGVPRRVVQVATTTDYLTSCAMFLDAVRERTVSHLATEGQAALDESVAVCDKKARGKSGAWGWVATTADGDETPIEAVSLAHWGARTTKRRPGRKSTGVVMR